MLFLALALQAAEPTYSEAVMSRGMELAACVTIGAARHAGDQVSTTEAAEAALRDCAAEDRALAAQFEADLGARGAAEMAAARTRNRERAVRNVAERRGERSPAPLNPIQVWGGCVGASARAQAATSQDADAIAARALDACRTEEQAAHAFVTRAQGAAGADATMRSLRDNLPALVRQAIAANRELQ